MNVSSLAPNPTSTAPQGELREKFDQFVGESLFGQMLKGMRKSLGKPAYFHGGRAEEVFQSQLDQLLVEKLSDASAEQISEPMYQLFMANRTPQHGMTDLPGQLSEQESQEAIGQLDQLQRQNQSQNNQSEASQASRLDLSI